MLDATLTSAGTRTRPPPLILSACAGMGMVEAGPAPRIRSPAVTTIELVNGGPPEPSISTAPMIALLWLSSGALQAEVTSSAASSADARFADFPMEHL